ncbi:MAG: hypothetical protein P4L79_10310 [Legionella sp.]|uniref:hypothetical protein n=1 Tax=Legionella sp. TaxID=459 RepID=UPI002843E63E|nr:hypothetical protein [Legionella sp.]
MANYMFQNIANDRLAAGIPKSDRAAAAAWYRNAAQQVTGASGEQIKRNPMPFQNIEKLSVNSIGKMYLFNYDPKHKLKLPYYDVFPLIFPIELYKDSILGINMHYLSPYHRAKLMDALYQTITDDKYNSRTKLKINYQILKGASQFGLFKPCIHKYLFDTQYLKSPFMAVNPEVWDYTLMLPLADFRKKSQEVVWMESLLKAAK